MKLLRDQGPEARALEHLESDSPPLGSEPDEILRREHRREAANQVTVGNCVLSLRLLSAIDWNSFFEQSSRVEAILREDPAGIYCRQDFQTSDRYRRVIEAIARRSHADEIEVARHAIELARRARSSGSSPRDHVGFYLIDRGQEELKATFNCKADWREPRQLGLEALGGGLLRRQSRSLGAIGTLIIAAIPGSLAPSGGSPSCGGLAASAQRAGYGPREPVLTLFLSPKVLPKLEFKDGIPADHATFIVIPAMLTNPLKHCDVTGTFGDPLPREP